VLTRIHSWLHRRGIARAVNWEITKVVVRDCRKLHEHADIREALDRVAKEAGA
jgi:hypothetical protein